MNHFAWYHTGSVQAQTNLNKGNLHCLVWLGVADVHTGVVLHVLNNPFLACQKSLKYQNPNNCNFLDNTTLLSNKPTIQLKSAWLVCCHLHFKNALEICEEGGGHVSC